ncbi:MAG: hypothetical protein Q9201_001145 [Fulgogasparrea decipioides]
MASNLSSHQWIDRGEYGQMYHPKYKIDPIQSFSNHPGKSRLNSRLRSLIHQARSLVEETWSEIRQWKTTGFSVTSIRLPDTYSLAVLSAWKLSVQLVEESYKNIVDYYDRISRYLKAAKEYEETLQRKRKQNDTSIAITPSRQTVIEMIATRAELRPEKIPYPAFIGEWVVRNTVKWNDDDSLLTWVSAKAPSRLPTTLSLRRTKRRALVAQGTESCSRKKDIISTRKVTESTWLSSQETR